MSSIQSNITRHVKTNLAHYQEKNHKPKITEMMEIANKGYKSYCKYVQEFKGKQIKREEN